MLMQCSLRKEAPKEHKSITDSRYAETFVECPLFNNKQICLWCCLHICDLADPMTRPRAREDHQEYVELLDRLTGRELDSVQETCYRCRNKR